MSLSSALTQNFEPLEQIAERHAEAARVPTMRWAVEESEKTSWMTYDANQAKIMLVDDEPVNIKVVREYLRLEGYRNFVACDDPRQVIETIRRERPDVVVLDVMMPEISGLDLLREMRSAPDMLQIPVIILTAADDRGTRTEALNEGATDFLTKPVEPTELLPRVRNAVVIKAHMDTVHNYAETLRSQVERRTTDLAASRLELLHCLARVAEFRDNETGRHVLRVGRYSGIIARQLGMSPLCVELIELASPLHDMGKIGIPDAILRKTGGLDDEEMAIMRKHCGYGKMTFESLSSDEWKSLASHTFVGETILEASRSPILEVAARIALTHHERWDGDGYPLGLSGESIPIEGRITSVADVFDALSSQRPYKPAFPLDKCFDLLEEGRGTQFDPKVVDAFFAGKDEIIEVKIGFADID